MNIIEKELYTDGHFGGFEIHTEIQGFYFNLKVNLLIYNHLGEDQIIDFLGEIFNHEIIDAKNSEVTSIRVYELGNNENVTISYTLQDCIFNIHRIDLLTDTELKRAIDSLNKFLGEREQIQYN